MTGRKEGGSCGQDIKVFGMNKDPLIATGRNIEAPQPHSPGGRGKNERYITEDEIHGGNFPAAAGRPVHGRKFLPQAEGVILAEKIFHGARGGGDDDGISGPWYEQASRLSLQL